jgi:hypothetical protein
MRHGKSLIKKRTTKPFVPRHSSIVCSVSGVVSICRGLCEPIEGLGICGRLAPHAMIGRTQKAIQNYRLVRLGELDG